MAEAGPSSLASSSRHSRVLIDTIPSEASSKPIGSLGPPPLLRNTTQSPEQGSRHSRRRTTSEALQSSSLGNKKVMQSVNRASTKSGKRPTHMIDVPEPGLDAFSDEYDLGEPSHSLSFYCLILLVHSPRRQASHALLTIDEAHVCVDPGIMEDVQRAIKMKARREARLKGLSLNSSGKSSSRVSELSPRSSFSTGSSPTTPSRMSTGITFPTSDALSAGESEVDFRPSVSVTVSHPVPRSIDDGATLDWSGSKLSDEKFDRRWSLSIARRKPKERSTSAFDKPFAENQGQAYTGVCVNQCYTQVLIAI
jgi:hypothetical protein